MATMTAAQRRAQAKAEYNAFLAMCPSRKLLDRISDKWVVLILSALGSSGSHQRQLGGESSEGAEDSKGSESIGGGCEGEPRAMRYSELSRLLAGVSQKMLTQTLRSLERDGLITRTATPTVPVTVTYELTDLGLSLHQMVRGVKAWAEAHMDDVLANREAYDGGGGETAGTASATGAAGVANAASGSGGAAGRR